MERRVSDSSAATLAMKNTRVIVDDTHLSDIKNTTSAAHDEDLESLSSGVSEKNDDELPEDPFLDISEDCQPSSPSALPSEGYEAGFWSSADDPNFLGSLGYYTAIPAGSIVAAAFDSSTDSIFEWLLETGATEFSFTLLVQGNTPTVIVFSETLANLPSETPLNLPFLLIRQSFRDFTKVFDAPAYEEEPREPWYADKCLPGASIGCHEAGSLGGYLRANTGEIFALTAGHVARVAQEAQKVLRGQVVLTSPTKADSKMARAQGSIGKISTKMKYDRKIETAKCIIKASRQNPENIELSERAESCKRVVELITGAHKGFREHIERSATGPKEFGRTLVSVVDMAKMPEGEADENVRQGWQINQDWALLKVQPERRGRNVIELQDRTLRFDSFGTIRAGMIVAKKGRSTGLTFGKINGVKLNIKLENSRSPTTE
ncbi:hypothetical protein TWF281_011046 [Arthrobotrys megalospora]